MNPFLIVILAAVLVEFALQLTADLLNLRCLTGRPPAALADIYVREEYARSQQYTRELTRLDISASIYRLAVLLAFWFAGGFNAVDQVVRSWGLVPMASGLVYVGAITLGSGFLMLPFGIYATFVVEERFGFNRTTPRTFLLDRLRGLSLSILLGGPLLAALLALFDYAGPYAWLYCWGAFLLFSVVFQFVAPSWIMPLFNKFTPLEPGELRNAIMDYARRVGFSISNVFVVDGSRRSAKSNAFLTGFGSRKRVALYDTLIEKHTIPELVAVLAHEIGHHKKRHITKGMALGMVQSGVLLFLLSVFISSEGLFDAFFVEEPSTYVGLLLFGLLLTPIVLPLSVGLRALSRQNEYEADRYAAETVGQPRSLVDALKKLSAVNLANLTPHPFYVLLNYSHPPLLQRVLAIERCAAQAPELTPSSQSDGVA